MLKHLTLYRTLYSVTHVKAFNTMYRTPFSVTHVKALNTMYRTTLDVTDVKSPCVVHGFMWLILKCLTPYAELYLSVTDAKVQNTMCRSQLVELMLSHLTSCAESHVA